MLNKLSKCVGRPCDKGGNYLPANSQPPCWTSAASDDWTPYQDRLEFEFADFIFRRNQMSAGDIDDLLDLWAASLLKHGDCPPFADHKDLYNTIDASPQGDVPWNSFSTVYSGRRPDDNVPPWMDTQYDVWWRDPRIVVQNMLGNPDFDGAIDYAPYQEFEQNGERRFCDFFSGDWVWQQAVRFVNPH
jgi:Plavaka transposase